MNRSTTASIDIELRHRLDAIYHAHLAASYDSGRPDLPSLSESRDLLRLFARLGNEDLRHALLCLLRTIAGPTH